MGRCEGVLPPSSSGSAAHLHRMLQLTAQVIAQTTQRLQWIMVIPDRLVSVFDPEARPIRRGKLSAKTEFGYNWGVPGVW